MDKAGKHELGKMIQEKASKAHLIILTDYRGLKAGEADLLRKRLREAQVYSKVVKNNVARIALKEAKMGAEVNAFMDGVVGPTLMSFAMGDPARAAKVIFDFTKEVEAFSLKEGIFNNKKLTNAQIEQLANLPSREVLLAQLLGVFNGPARSFVSVLAAVPRGFVTVLAAVRDKKEKQS
jgi:large subunit ribosomal protein L10